MNIVFFFGKKVNMNIVCTQVMQKMDYSGQLP